ncbi:hypothetical protein J4211_04900 [Candidatus Woesearchaeota archaeon]|nr:hypothetical protein [Candidatus Woesearchaeota archaeon]
MHFSHIELKELAKALLAVSLMFTIAYVGLSTAAIGAFPIILLTAGLGFVLHELGHKFLAQKYGCWAEFRANNQMLLLGVLLSITGIVLAAPGGVYIRGATIQQHGKIAITGPLVNVFLASLFGFLYFLFSLTLLKYGFSINSFLAMFNMIPFPPFDGHAAWNWNRAAYGVVAIAAIVLVALSTFV